MHEVILRSLRVIQVCSAFAQAGHEREQGQHGVDVPLFVGKRASRNMAKLRGGFFVVGKRGKQAGSSRGGAAKKANKGTKKKANKRQHF